MNFNKEYDTWHQKMGEHEKIDAGLSYPWHITTARLLPDLNSYRVLEVGCGRGDFALWLASKSPEAKITAIDFSDSAIALAKERAVELEGSVQFEVGDAQSLRFKEKDFDVVISCECLEHVPYPKRMIEELYRVLRPGGRFILTTENYCNGMVLAWINSWITGKPFDSGSGIQPHENFFLYWRVKRLLEQSGLIVSHMESNHYQWLLLPRVAPALLCTEDFNHRFFKRLFRPFGRHYTFSGFRPK